MQGIIYSSASTLLLERQIGLHPQSNFVTSPLLFSSLLVGKGASSSLALMLMTIQHSSLVMIWEPLLWEACIGDVCSSHEWQLIANHDQDINENTGCLSWPFGPNKSIMLILINNHTKC